ncbi:hypothetical protein [Albidovulum aquaemixtae]|nr:hypothetical protein [Defluviimonas aquaemixtae]
MQITRRRAVGLAALSLPFLRFRPARAASATVKVSLWDKGGSSMDMLGKLPRMGMAMPGMADMGRMATMGITATPDSVAAGDVTFEVTNDSEVMIHEMVVSPVRDAKTPMAYDPGVMKIDEDAAGHLGEVAELDYGKAGALRLPMNPGRHILYGNIPGHYVLGMWAFFTVI